MFKTLKIIVDDPHLAKIIFEHFRNVAVSAAVLSAAAWIYENLDSSPGWRYYVDLWAVLSLALIGVFLFTLNEIQGHRRLSAKKIPPGGELLIRLIYTSGIIALIVSVATVPLR